MSILTRLQATILGILVWAAALFFAPWFYIDSFEYPKAIFLIIATGLLTVITLAQLILGNAPFSWKKIPIEIKLLGGMVFAECIAFAFSTNHSLSLAGAPYRFQGLIGELTLAVFFLNAIHIFRNLLNAPAQKKTSPLRDFFAWVVGSAVITSCVSLLPFFIDTSFLSLAAFKNRAYGTFGNPNYLAVFLIGLTPLLSIFFASKYRIVRAIAYISFAIILVTLFLTGCRSAWIALIAGLVVAAILTIKKKRSYKMLLIISIIIAIMISIFVFQRYNETKIFHRLSLTEDNTGSVTTRLYLQEAGLKLFLTRPVFGIGQDTIVDQIEPYLPEYLKANSVFYIDRTHNEFLDVLVMQGMVGFLAYISFWVVLIWNAMKHYLHKKYKKDESDREKIFLLCLASILAILLYYAMNFATISGNILLYLLAGYIIAEQYITPSRQS
ncbi:MAG: O-antigen ligase family protein [Candidatus Peregrinibacteria bacterium]|nr:O-antigen ligase family protein [Candidatus Peregrinibacteria bacterium]